MSGTSDDRHLREAFRHLRSWAEGPERSPPSFQVMLERARRQAKNVPRRPGLGGLWRRPGRPLPWPRTAVRTGLAAAAVAGILLMSGARDPEVEFRRLISTYAATSQSLSMSPTSRLLEVPGLELVRSVPSVGVPERSHPVGETRELPAPGREIRS